MFPFGGVTSMEQARTARFPLNTLDTGGHKGAQCNVCRVCDSVTRWFSSARSVRQVSNQTSSDKKILHSCYQTRIHRCHSD